MIRNWNSYWFKSESAVDLGVFRIIFYGSVAAGFLSSDFSGLGAIYPLMFKPIHIFNYLPIFDAAILRILQTAWKISLFFCAVGFLTRWFQIMSFVLGVYLLGLMQCFGYVHLQHSLFVWCLAIMAVSRSGDFLSLDWVISVKSKRLVPESSWEYGWPIKVIRFLTVIMVLQSALIKIKTAGTDWVFGDTLAIYLTSAQIPPSFDSPNGRPLLDYGLWLAKNEIAPKALAGATLFIELLFPISLISYSARLTLPFAFILFLCGFNLLLGSPVIRFFLPVFLAWVPWNEIMQAIRSKR